MKNFFDDTQEEIKKTPMKLSQSAKLKDKIDTGYSTFRISSEFLDCSLSLVLDPYNMCSGNCFYCFAYVFKQSNSAFSADRLKSISLNKLERMLSNDYDYNGKNLFHKYFLKNKKVIQIGSLSDMFDDFEKKYQVGHRTLELLIKYQNPCRISTKFIPLENTMSLLESNKNKNLFAFMYSIITTDEKVSKEIEEDVPSPKERLKQLKILSDMGYYTVLRLRPFIMGISDKTLDDLLEKAKDAGIKAVSVEFYCLDSRAKKEVKERNNAHFSKFLGIDFFKYYKKLSEGSNRKSYQRLNRDVKEIYIRKIYKFCLDNKIHFACSDPDYKELNMSGSCCGLPDHVDTEEANISTFSKCQMTNLVRLARKEFWEKNTVKGVLKNKIEDVELTLRDLASLDKDVKNTFLFSNENQEFLSIYKRDIPSGMRYLYHPFRIIQKYWNDINTSVGFANYFDNKIIPIRKDKKNNLVYKYQVMPYEILWQDTFGFDLKEN